MSAKKLEGLPDFLVIGAGKSGTTSLDKYLNQHPQIFIPKKKEPNFFGYENMKEEDFDGDQEEIDHFRNSVTTLDRYLKMFENAKPDQLRGETSNTYMYHEQAPFRIKYYNPDMKLIAVLRQPAGRLYSRFMHLARENRTPTEEFAACLDRDSIWWRRNDLIKEGFYFKNLSKFYELFPHENIRVYLYEDLQDKPLEVMKDIYGFLGVDTSFQPDTSIRYNESGLIKNKFLDKIYGQGGILSKAAKAILPNSVLQRVSGNLLINKRLLEIRRKNLARPGMDPVIRKKLTHEVYGDDIRQLQNLIKRDLSHWLKH